jgi:pimeloyl-ACP methyl ester carboxylesterase
MAPTTVVSRDGTPIAYWTSGEGPALVLVHGASADHTRWHALLPHLEPHFTLHVVDRRGRGASGDKAGYALEDEAADIAALAETIGDEVSVLGHSYGAMVALEASLRTSAITKLALYEPGVGVAMPPGFTDRMAGLLAQGRREEILLNLYDHIGMPSDQVEISVTLPSWPGRVAAAHTVVRELRAKDDYLFDAARYSHMTARTLVLIGGDSPPVETAAAELVAKALPHATMATLPGQGQVAMLTGPKPFAAEVLRFLRS